MDAERRARRLLDLNEQRTVSELAAVHEGDVVLDHERQSVAAETKQAVKILALAASGFTTQCPFGSEHVLVRFAYPFQNLSRAASGHVAPVHRHQTVTDLNSAIPLI